MVGNDYISMMVEQLRLLIHSKLFSECDKLYIGVTQSEDRHPENGIEWLNFFFNSFDQKPEIVAYPQNTREDETLKWIEAYAKQNPDDYIMYFHTKGITKKNEATEDWRRYMEYFVIENWPDCIEKLDEGFDCCGVLWNKFTPIGLYPHFSGGMWWAKASYINTLDPTYLRKDWIYYREFWIGSNPRASVYEFHNSRLNDAHNLTQGKGHYDVKYPRTSYEK